MKLRPLLVAALIAAVIPLTGCLFSRAPRAEFTFTPPSGYPPFTVHFDASPSSSPDGIIISYAWDFGDGASGSGCTIDHTFTEKGVYHVCLTVTDSTGKVGMISHPVRARNRPPDAAFTCPNMVGKGDPVYFDASGSSDPDGEIVEYLWDFGDGTTAAVPSPTHTYQRAGSYPVTLTVIDDDGAKSSPVTKYVQVIGCGCGS